MMMMWEGKMGGRGAKEGHYQVKTISIYTKKFRGLVRILLSYGKL